MRFTVETDSAYQKSALGRFKMHHVDNGQSFESLHKAVLLKFETLPSHNRATFIPIFRTL
ncbi:hypothetical protein BGZ76_004796 [Entomortierella beljakovae]|nr:hypothetical protein BGZ76_004796 [Entomortierella beljakovae]